MLPPFVNRFRPTRLRGSMKTSGMKYFLPHGLQLPHSGNLKPKGFLRLPSARRFGLAFPSLPSFNPLGPDDLGDYAAAGPLCRASLPLSRRDILRSQPGLTRSRSGGETAAHRGFILRPVDDPEYNLTAGLSSL